MHAIRLQISVYRGYDLCHSGLPKKLNFYILTDVTSKSRSNSGRIWKLVQRCQMHPQCKSGDPKSVTFIDNEHNYLYDDLKPSNRSR